MKIGPAHPVARTLSHNATPLARYAAVVVPDRQSVSPCPHSSAVGVRPRESRLLTTAGKRPARTPVVQSAIVLPPMALGARITLLQEVASSRPSASRPRKLP